MGRPHRVHLPPAAGNARALTAFALAVWLVAAAGTAAAQTCAPLRSTPISGPAAVIDGDSLIFTETVAGEVRLFGIDAPEMRDGAALPHALAARRRLASMIANAPVVCTPVDVDRYCRTVAVCRRADGEEDLALTLVRGGHAWLMRRYLYGRPRHVDTERYEAAEREAAENRRGVWALVPPSND
jgi:endonuclease YncB( thermonuclease family)